MNGHVSFCYVWMSFKTCTMPHVVNISFIMVVSKFVSVDEMKELVIVKNLPYSDVINMLPEKNSHVYF